MLLWQNLTQICVLHRGEQLEQTTPKERPYNEDYESRNSQAMESAMNYTLELRLKDAEGTVVWKATEEIQINIQIGFGKGEYGSGGYGDSEVQE